MHKILKEYWILPFVIDYISTCNHEKECTVFIRTLREKYSISRKLAKTIEYVIRKIKSRGTSLEDIVKGVSYISLERKMIAILYRGVPILIIVKPHRVRSYMINRNHLDKVITVLKSMKQPSLDFKDLVKSLNIHPKTISIIIRFLIASGCLIPVKKHSYLISNSEDCALLLEKLHS